MPLTQVAQVSCCLESASVAGMPSDSDAAPINQLHFHSSSHIYPTAAAALAENLMMQLWPLKSHRPGLLIKPG